VEPAKLRGKPEKFADHYTQAQLFYRSQSAVEQAHIARAFRFELTRVQTQAVRERMVAMVRNVDEALAAEVADGLGMPLPAPLPTVLPPNPAPEVEVSPALSLLARPGDGSVTARRIALLVADGIQGAGLQALYAALLDAGAVPRYVGAKLGTVTTAEGDTLAVDVTMEAAPAVLFDAAVLPPGGVDALLADAHALDFVRLQYRHCKPLLVPASAQQLLQEAGVWADGAEDSGLVLAEDDAVDDAQEAFLAAVGRHRAWERFEDPPSV
jgi:catalase